MTLLLFSLKVISSFSLLVKKSPVLCNDLAKFETLPDLAKGFGNANIYAAQAATHQGFQDYSIFAVTTGFMIGVQLPSSDLNYYDDLDKKIEDEFKLQAYS